MASKDIEFKVGIIILIGIIILGGSLYWLRDYQLERHAQLIKVRFGDVGTLEVGDKVTVSGVRAGKVSKLTLTERGVVVELQLSRDVVLRRDAVIAIKNLGLMGERFIAIDPGQDSVLFDASGIVDGVYDTGLPEVLGLMGEMIVELRSLVGSFKRSIGSDSSLQKFNNTVNNLESVTASLADYMERNEDRLDQTADNFYKASRQLNRMLTDNSERVDSAATRVDRMTVKLEDFVGQLDTLSTSFRHFAQQLENPDGTLQLLMEDRRLYDDLRKTADNIDDLINDIRENPRKYINLKVELF
ncbi:MAG: MCE family protein [Candidatus Zixiibacteriota bacterium]|nr:MAG: MCE family protein [candidate division Zixibacteria bacterium]